MGSYKKKGARHFFEVCSERMRPQAQTAAKKIPVRNKEKKILHSESTQTLAHRTREVRDSPSLASTENTRH